MRNKLNQQAKKSIVKAVSSLNQQPQKNPYIKEYGIKMGSVVTPTKLRKYLLRVERSRAKPKDNDVSNSLL